MPIACYGKLPICSDFVTLGDIDTAFPVVREWLHSAFIAAMSRLPEGWDAAYRVAPMWRFATSAGVLSGLPVVGLMSPSADRAGRLFPVVLLTDANDSEAWYEAAESLLLDVFAGRLSAVADFISRMETLDAGGDQDTGSVNPSPGAILAMGALPGRVSVWWTHSQSIDGPSRMFTALPSGVHLVALFGEARVERSAGSNIGEQGYAEVTTPWTAGNLSAGVSLIVFGEPVPGLQALVNAAASEVREPASLARLLALVETLHTDISGWMDDLHVAGGVRPAYAGIAAMQASDERLAVSLAGHLVVREWSAGSGNECAMAGDGEAPRAFTVRRKHGAEIHVAVARAAVSSMLSVRDRAGLPEVVPGVHAGILGPMFIVWFAK